MVVVLYKSHLEGLVQLLTVQLGDEDKTWSVILQCRVLQKTRTKVVTRNTGGIFCLDMSNVCGNAYFAYVSELAHLW